MPLNYRGSEILTDLLIHPNGTRYAGCIIQNQKVIVQCNNCNIQKTVNYIGHASHRIKSKDEYLCSKCVNGKRITRYNIDNTGIPLEDRIGIIKAEESRKKQSDTFHKNKNKGLHAKRLGNTKTWDERYGIDKSNELKDWMRHNHKMVPRFGEDNPQWGKPAHKLSGKGIKGYYNGIFFRSLMEASFMINYLERNKLTFENGELKKYAIPYILENRHRNYFCDFVVGNIFYEIKPLALHNTLQNRMKWESAKVWCPLNGYEFKIFSEYDFDLLKRWEIDNLISDGKLVLL